jgi:hypothetical protein
VNSSASSRSSCIIRCQQATPQIRRLINQALFKALLVLDGKVSEAELTQWVAAIRALVLTAVQPGQKAQNGGKPAGAAAGTTTARFRGPWVCVRQRWCAVRDSNPPRRIKSPELYPMS